MSYYEAQIERLAQALAERQATMGRRSPHAPAGHPNIDPAWLARQRETFKAKR